MSKKIAFSAETRSQLRVGDKVYIEDHNGRTVTAKVINLNFVSRADAISVRLKADVKLTPRSAAPKGSEEWFYSDGRWVAKRDSSRIVAFKKPKTWKKFKGDKTKLQVGTQVKMRGSAGVHKGVVSAAAEDSDYEIKVDNAGFTNPSGGISPRSDGSWTFNQSTGDFNWPDGGGYLTIVKFSK